MNINAKKLVGRIALALGILVLADYDFMAFVPESQVCATVECMGREKVYGLCYKMGQTDCVDPTPTNGIAINGTVIQSCDLPHGEVCFEMKDFEYTIK